MSKAVTAEVSQPFGCDTCSGGLGWLRARFAIPMWEGGQRMMRTAASEAFADVAAPDRIVTATREAVGPWNTTAIVRWTSVGTPLDGAPYENHKVHIVQTRWGTAVSIDANEDSQAVADLLRRQAACGIEEAAAPPIQSQSSRDAPDDDGGTTLFVHQQA